MIYQKPSKTTLKKNNLSLFRYTYKLDKFSKKQCIELIKLSFLQILKKLTKKIFKGKSK